ncbi:helix-turn-helix domain-containing protein [Roseisolibacter sp. H3M3-2]|uniref:AraC family transcriptional regulator n=1 Tax=Roseisolibacter sp. H3M3-2 TaxID=3031323 RepID=UPI0023D9D922|nr:helix-turn-helix domain-containing protein [Roseisolibacter sp. H3M3-2]MDF1505016.1 helix-turn-helix domain-containing protein [Roseisolibacter sp. H3M3-2]
MAALLRELAGSPCLCISQLEVRARLRSGGIRGLIIAHTDRDGRSTLALVSEVRRDFPDVYVLAYGELGKTPSSAFTAMIRAGAHEMLQFPIDDSRSALEDLIKTANRTNVSAQVYDAIADSLDPVARPLVQLYLRGADGPVPVIEAAIQLGVHRKTLRNRMDAVGLPAPADLRAWCRLFLAARLMDEPGRTVESVALELDFASGSALRNLLRRRTGLAPYQLREAGGLRCLVERFDAECAQRRAGLLPPNEHEDGDEDEATPGEREVGVPTVALPSRVAEPASRATRRVAPRRVRADDARTAP